MGLYVFVQNATLQRFDFLGLLAFYHDPLKFSFAGAGGMFIGQEIGADQTFGSTDVGGAFKAAMDYFDITRDGRLSKSDCPPFDLRVTGYSWGSWSALALAHRLNRRLDDLDDMRYIMGLLDPVDTARQKYYPPGGGPPRRTPPYHRRRPRVRIRDLPANAAALVYYQANGCRGLPFTRCPGPSIWFKGMPINGAQNVDLTSRGWDHVDIQQYGPRVAKHAFN